MVRDDASESEKQKKKPRRSAKQFATRPLDTTHPPPNAALAFLPGLATTSVRSRRLGGQQDGPRRTPVNAAQLIFLLMFDEIYKTNIVDTLLQHCRYITMFYALKLMLYSSSSTPILYIQNYKTQLIFLLMFEIYITNIVDTLLQYCRYITMLYALTFMLYSRSSTPILYIQNYKTQLIFLLNTINISTDVVCILSSIHGLYLFSV